jgi:hypothetical protein
MIKPSFKWPIITLIAGVYVFGAAFVDAFIDTEGDRFEAMAAMPLAAAWIAVCLLIINKRIDRLDEWKEQRRMEWALNRDLPALEYTDWEKFERDVETNLRPRMPDPTRRNNQLNPFRKRRDADVNW